MIFILGLNYNISLPGYAIDENCRFVGLGTNHPADGLGGENRGDNFSILGFAADDGKMLVNSLETSSFNRSFLMNRFVCFVLSFFITKQLILAFCSSSIASSVLKKTADILHLESSSTAMDAQKAVFLMFFVMKFRKFIIIIILRFLIVCIF